MFKLVGATPSGHLSLHAQAESLSGACGGAVPDAVAHLVTNDRNIARVLPEVRGTLRSQPGGVGIFIGSAAIASLAPDLSLDLAAEVDANEAVLAFSAGLNQTIVAEAETLRGLGDQSSICSHVAKNIASTGFAAYDPGFIEQELISEASRLGSEHWSSPARVGCVADALRAREPAYITADISNPRFLTAFAALCHKHDRQITFANLTNVHEYIGQDMGFLRRLPFAREATIMYSVDDHMTPLQAQVAGSLDEYIHATSRAFGSVNAGAGEYA